MERFVIDYPSPFIAKVYKSGEVKAGKGKDDLLKTVVLHQLLPSE